MVTDTAKLIEQAHFIDISRDRWLLRLSRAAEYLDLGPDCTLAVDDSSGIVLSTREPRDQLQITQRGMNLKTLFVASLDDLLVGGSGKRPLEIRTGYRGTEQGHAVRFLEAEG